MELIIDDVFWGDELFFGLVLLCGVIWAISFVEKTFFEDVLPKATTFEVVHLF